jgi:hypothetical protein
VSNDVLTSGPVDTQQGTQEIIKEKEKQTARAANPKQLQHVCPEKAMLTAAKEDNGICDLQPNSHFCFCRMDKLALCSEAA